MQISRITRAKKSKNKRTRLYQCLEPRCKRQFSATVGTIFQDSHLSLKKWFAAIAIFSDSKQDVSAYWMKEYLNVNYRTALHLSHKIRQGMQEAGGILRKLSELKELHLSRVRQITLH